ncbi:MAG: hypothetical protein H0X65_23245 [Gemmatimonadetes bacterium]|nr:hypothetical protein [Gemmatimonadota bacterium]
MGKSTWLAALAILMVGCRGESDGDIRQAYDRMIETEARREAEAPPPTPRESPAPPPTALPMDTVPSAPAPVPEPAPTPVPPVAQDTAPRAAEPAAQTEQRERPGQGAVTLRDVRTARHEEFDRIVFEFDGGMPGHRVEYSTAAVRECGSGRAVQVAGEGRLRVRLEPARAHEFVGEQSRVTVANRNRSLDYAVVRQLTLTCDFEAQVEWVLGVTAPNRFRVLELSEPARLVVDVFH